MLRSVFIDRTIKALEIHFSVRLVELEALETNLNFKFAHPTKLLTEQELVAVRRISISFQEIPCPFTIVSDFLFFIFGDFYHA